MFIKTSLSIFFIFANFFLLFPQNAFALEGTCKPFDYNKDGVIDNADTQLLSFRYGQKNGDPLYETKYDANSDGKIDSADVDFILGCDSREPLPTKYPKDPPKDAIDTALGKISTDPAQLVNTILTIAIGIAGGIAFLLIVFGGFRMAFSNGDPKAVQEAREVITSAIIGLLLIVFSVFLLNLIGVDILGLPIGDKGNF